MPISRNSAGKPHCLPRQGPVRPLYPNESRGLLAPCTPRQGHWPWTHFATYNRIEQGCFRMRVAETKNSTTGEMKTKKKAGQESELSCRFFLVFPGCSASGWRHSAAGPCAAVPQSIRKVTIFFCQGVSACFLEGGRQSLRPCGPAPFTQGSLLYMFQRENA